jgi:hypothetical protein
VSLMGEPVTQLLRDFHCDFGMTKLDG